VQIGARRKRSHSAFTLIELIVVVAIILILAGLVLSTFDYAKKKGRRARAETEIAAISAACESYKADNGIYPRGNGALGNTNQPYDTDQLGTNSDPQGGNPANFVNSALYLYRQLSGDSDGDPTTSGAGDTRSYFSCKPNMLNPSPPGPNTYIKDPFGYAYGYSTLGNANPGDTRGNNPTFDLWSTCGETAKKTGETFQQYQLRWIKNW
jgi:prepilin-type N-terminal cleavage/methylation domain-containing protein